MIQGTWFKCPDCEHRVLSTSWAKALKQPCPDHPDSDIRPDTEANDRLNRKTSRSKNTWCDGKAIFQLNPTNPDYMVTSEKQMTEAYERNGLCMETGGYKDGRAKVEAGNTEAFKKDKYKRLKKSNKK